MGDVVLCDGLQHWLFYYVFWHRRGLLLFVIKLGQLGHLEVLFGAVCTCQA